MTYTSDDGRVRLLLGDCRQVMAGMEPESVDAIVTDPPYGLEFMGKEWDKLLDDLPNAPALADRRGYQDTTRQDRSQPSSRHGSRFRGKPRQFKRCRVCGKRQWSGSPCRCPNPEWGIEYPEGPVSGMVAMQRWHLTWATAAPRVLKPGAHLVAFGGTRTHHRLWCALEDAGFEIRDTLIWLYGSGFPKSLDVSKAIDKAAGAEREKVQPGNAPAYQRSVGNTRPWMDDPEHTIDGPEPITDAARQWGGWGTALKPAFEPIVLARKPLSERTVAANVQRWGTGALNVDGCRLTVDTDDPNRRRATGENGGADSMFGVGNTRRTATLTAGRWPANVVLDEDAAAMLDAQSGETSAPCGSAKRQDSNLSEDAWLLRSTPPRAGSNAAYVGDSGGASRFFYCAKADSAERRGSKHPTIKPLALMKWLVTLVTPPGGLMLDPLCGSGTTLEAAYQLGHWAIGIDREAEYLEDAKRRLRQGVLL